MLKFWNITVLEIPRHRFHLSVTSERVGGWGGVHVFSRRSLHTWGEYSLLHDTAHSTSNPRNLFFLYLFFFLLSMFRKNNFRTDCVLCKFTVINATQISKFERECSSSNNPLTPQGFFLFPSSFPHKR